MLLDRAAPPLNFTNKGVSMKNLSSDLPENPDVIKNAELPAQPEQPAPPEQIEQDQPVPKTPDPEQKADPEVDAKTRANRENAQKSTGPRTPAGRDASSKNAVKHGLFIEDLTQHLSEEQLEHYQSFVEGIVKDLHPVGELELHLAHRVADIQFRFEMLRTAELKIYLGAAILTGTMEGYLLAGKNPIGLASLYDQRFQRSFSKTLEEFRRAQQLRLDQEKQAVEELKAIAAAHMQQNAPFDPARFGFVISRELLFNKVRLGNAKKMAQFCTGDGIVEKKVVACLSGDPKKAA
jgi:type IV secretory pathway VirB10-like protein